MPGKRRRLLSEVSGIGGVSDASLNEILKFVKKHPEVVEEEPSHQRISEAATLNLKEAGAQKHTFLLKDGRSTFEWTFLPVRSALAFFCQKSQLFRRCLQDTIAEHGTMLDLVLYTDDFVPGIVLKLDSRKKSAVWHGSIRQFGPLLCHCEMWIAIATLRTTILADIPGNYSAVSRVLLRDMFLGAASLYTVGVALPLLHETAFLQPQGFSGR